MSESILDKIREISAREDERKAAELGVSVESFQQERKERAERDAQAYRLAQRKKNALEAERRESRLLEAIENPSQKIKANKSALSKVIRWTSSRFNEYKKADVIDMISRRVREQRRGEGYEPHCETYSCGSYSNYSDMSAGSDYRLVIEPHGAYLLVDFDTPRQVVYELDAD